MTRSVVCGIFATAELLVTSYLETPKYIATKPTYGTELCNHANFHDDRRKISAPGKNTYFPHRGLLSHAIHFYKISSSWFQALIQTAIYRFRDIRISEGQNFLDFGDLGDTAPKTEEHLPGTHIYRRAKFHAHRSHCRRDICPRVKQELSYRKQIARQLRMQYVEGIYDNPVTLKSRFRVTGGHWKRNNWVDHTRLTISQVIWRWILLWPWNVGQRSLRVIKNGTGSIWKLGYGFLFAFYSNYGRIFSHFGDIQRQRMIWPWNLGLGSFKGIENSAVR